MYLCKMASINYLPSFSLFDIRYFLALAKVDLNQTDFRKALRDRTHIPATGSFTGDFFGPNAGNANLACTPPVLAGRESGPQPVV